MLNELSSNERIELSDGDEIDWGSGNLWRLKFLSPAPPLVPVRNRVRGYAGKVELISSQCHHSRCCSPHPVRPTHRGQMADKLLVAPFREWINLADFLATV